jgi:hypothetical protein
MATNDTITLPPGFVLDEMPQRNIQDIGLPPGFVLDKPQPTLAGKTADIINRIKEFTLPTQPVSKVIGERPTINPILASLALQERAQPLMQERPGAPYLWNLIAGPILRTAREMGLTKPTTMGTYTALEGLILGPAAERIATTPGGRTLIEKQLPTLGKQLLEKTKGIPVRPLTTPIKFVKNIINRGKASYIVDDVAPQVNMIYQQEIQKFTPQIQNYVKEIGVPDTAINTIKTKGYQNVIKRANELGNTTDIISRRILQGIESKRLEADTLYQETINNFKGVINASSFRQKLGMILRQKGWIDQVGRPTKRFGSKLDPVLDDLTRLHQDLRTIYKGKVIKGFKITKEDFSTYRDLLGRMLKDRPTDIAIMQLREALYQSAEQSGMKGIIKARDMERIAFNVEQGLTKKGLIGEKALNRFDKMTQADLRDLKEIEYYIQQPIIEDLKILNASKYLDKFRQIDEKTFVDLLTRGVDRRYTNQVYRELKGLLGENNAKVIIKEVISHRRARAMKKAIKRTMGYGLMGYGGFELGKKIVGGMVKGE